MLEIRDLSVKIENRDILTNLNLVVNSGEVHAIMGPNGAGKSTLTNILAGKDGYKIISGSIILNGKNLLEMEVETRASAGLFVGFQNPIEIPGVSLVNFLKAAVEAQFKARSQEAPNTAELLALIKEKTTFLGLEPDFYRKNLNAGLSGGQKKLSELLQLAVLEPQMAILDEIDSGLDIDAIQLVSAGLNKLRSPKRSFILITHYQRILNFVRPDFVHILKNGRIVKSGDTSLVEEIEANGYDRFN